MKQLFWVTSIVAALACSTAAAATFTVNDLGDAGDASPGDGDCATAGGVCTLRAAIEEAEASGGADTLAFELDVDNPSIATQSPLPTVADELHIDGSTHPDGVIVNGEDFDSDIPALVVTAELVQLSGLTLEGFNGPGIEHRPFNGQNAVITLTDVQVSNVCGWGVHSVGTVEAAGLRTYNNGLGRQCEGGGVYGLRAVQGTGVDTQDNGGPGVVSNEVVTLEGVTSLGNAGPGILSGGSVSLTGASRRDADNEVSNNFGAGIRAVEAAEVASLRATDNGAWGIYATTVTLGTDDDTVFASLLDRNGFGEECYAWAFDGQGRGVAEEEPCQGGGIYAIAGARVQRAASSGNNGPGVLSEADIELHLATLDANEAAGAQAAGGGSIAVTGDDNFIVNNYGRGLDTEGGVTLEGSMSCNDNQSWGVWAGGPVVLKRGAETPARQRAELVRNGLGDVCFGWVVTRDGLGPMEIPCTGGGALSRTGTIDAADINSGSNGGPGFYAMGNLTICRSDVDGNEGPGLLSQAGTVSCAEGDLNVTTNFGDAVVSRGGGVELSGAMIFDNQGAGVVSAGTVKFGFAADAEEASVGVFRNGGGDECYAWSPEVPAREEVECAGTGVHVTNGAFVSRLATVSGHAGDGIRVDGMTPDPATQVHVSIEDGTVSDNGAFAVVTGGDMNFFRGQVCNNVQGPFSVAGKTSLVEVIVCGDTDGDGVDNVVEDAGAPEGDGNGDGVPDSLQPNVATLPVAPDGFVTYEVPAPQVLSAVESSDPGGTFPAGIVFPWGTQSITVGGLTVGTNASVTAYTQMGGAPSGYYFYDGEVYLPATSGATEGDGITLTLVDGGPEDADGAANGQLTTFGGPTRTAAEDAGRPDGLDPTVPAEDEIPDPICQCETPASSRPLWAGFLLRR